MASTATKVTQETGKKLVRYFIGICVPTVKGNASKIEIPRYELDEYITMYFKTFDTVYAHDPEKKCKTGDTVLIQSLPEKMTRLITHKVIDVIYPLGDITDPVTGKKVIASQYRGRLNKKIDLYGRADSAFDYDKQPPRGWLEDVRDFTHKPSYKKYYEDPNDPQPYAVP